MGISTLGAVPNAFRIPVNGYDVNRAIIGHEMILSAIEQKDPDKAAQAMRIHLEMAEADLKKFERDTNA